MIVHKENPAFGSPGIEPKWTRQRLGRGRLRLCGFEHDLVHPLGRGAERGVVSHD